MMNNKEIFKKVGGIISELNEQYEYLSQNPDYLNELELELFSANANFLSDHISILVKINDKMRAARPAPISSQPEMDKPGDVSNPEPEIVHPTDPATRIDDDLNFEFQRNNQSDTERNDSDEGEIVTAAEEEEEEPAADGEDIPTESVDMDNDEQEQPEEDQVPSVEQDSPEDESTIKEVIISERTVRLDAEQIINEEVSPAKPMTVNELLSQGRRQETIGNRLNITQTKDLKSMVSLNDKLLFVRDLFNGYSLAYSEAIELLNRFDSMEAAENFLKQNYAVKNNWIEKAEVANKFYEILSRRFSK